jgi:hypothetical protein
MFCRSALHVLMNLPPKVICPAIVVGTGVVIVAVILVIDAPRFDFVSFW